jgi:hypothetical protein
LAILLVQYSIWPPRQAAPVNRGCPLLDDITDTWGLKGQQGSKEDPYVQPDKTYKFATNNYVCGAFHSYQQKLQQDASTTRHNQSQKIFC